jgi:hypothetical protein
VRQLAAALMPHLIGIDRINRVFKEGASKLAHSKGFAAVKNYVSLQNLRESKESVETASGDPPHMC